MHFPIFIFLYTVHYLICGFFSYIGVTFTFYIYAFSRRFYPKRLTLHSGYTFIVSMCVPWESNPQPLRC